MENYAFSFKRLWLIPIAMLFIILLLVTVDSSYLDTKIQYGCYNLTEDWDVVNENTNVNLSNVSLHEANIGKAGNFKPVTISRTIPDDNIPSKALIFCSGYCYVEVYLEDELIYTYGKDIVDAGRMAPNHYNIVPLPDDCIGKEFKIVFIPNEVFSFSGFSPVYYGNVEDAYRSILENSRLSLLVGAFLCVFGFAMFITSLYMIVYHRGNLALVFAANISFNIGTYTLCFNDIYYFIADADEFYTYIEYLSLYCIPLSIVVFLMASMQQFRRPLFYIMTVVNVIFVAYVMIVHALNIDHICNYVSVLHILAIVEGLTHIVTLVTSIVKGRKKKNDDLSIVGSIYNTNPVSSIVFLMGVLIFLVCAVVDIIIYNLTIYSSSDGEADASINFFIVGSLCFVLSILLNYFFISIEHIRLKNTKRRLQGLAYTDELTGLYNRARCELELVSLQQSSCRYYYVISIDVDRLKKVNDTLGHAMGDKLLTEFSETLKSALYDADLLGRMGGDEFIAIYKTEAEEVCQKALERLARELDAKNQIPQRQFYLSCSYGYAFGSKYGNQNPRDIYMEADAKMYEMKKIHHQKRA